MISLMIQRLKTDSFLPAYYTWYGCGGVGGLCFALLVLLTDALVKQAPLHDTAISLTLPVHPEVDNNTTSSQKSYTAVYKHLKITLMLVII